MGQAVADSNDLRTAIEARYSVMKAAMASHDSKALGAILAPNCVSIDTSDKSETADAMIAAVSSMPTDPNKISKTTKIGNDGAEHAVKLERISTDTWILTQGQWRIQRTTTNKLDYYIDGKLAAHKERANGTVNP
jgi:ribosomal silencing factor RsfS